MVRRTELDKRGASLVYQPVEQTLLCRIPIGSFLGVPLDGEELGMAVGLEGLHRVIVGPGHGSQPITQAIRPLVVRRRHL